MADGLCADLIAWISVAPVLLLCATVLALWVEGTSLSHFQFAALHASLSGRV